MDDLIIQFLENEAELIEQEEDNEAVLAVAATGGIRELTRK
jgi:hypothetical protein